MTLKTIDTSYRTKFARFLAERQAPAPDVEGNTTPNLGAGHMPEEGFVGGVDDFYDHLLDFTDEDGIDETEAWEDYADAMVEAALDTDRSLSSVFAMSDDPQDGTLDEVNEGGFIITYSRWYV